MTFREYDEHDALGLAALVREKKASPGELLDEAVTRVERTNPRLNAVVARLYDEGRRAADGPLPDGPFRGVPFLLKDLGAALAGAPLSEGCRFLAGQVPDHDSEIVARYKQAGLVIFGKTNTAELGLMPVTEPALFGPTENPWRPGLAVGGSSGGSAAAVAAGLVPAAHGGDGGGSLRIPASCCGVFGLKPTRARTPAGPDRSEAWSGLALQHAVTRSVRDSAALLDVAAGPEPGAPYHAPAAARPFLDEVSVPPGRLRIAFTRRPHLGAAAIHPDCLAALEDAAHLAADLGHQVEEADPPIDADGFAHDFFLTVCVETAVTLAQVADLVGRRVRPGDVETATWILSRVGRQQTALAAGRARERMQARARAVAGFFQRWDLLLTPTLGQPPVPHGALRPRGLEALMQEIIAATRLDVLLRVPGALEPAIRRVFGFMPFTPLANVTGQPSMSVPLFWSAAGLPIGTMFTARFGDEATLFRVAAQLEQARPWRGRLPPLHAAPT